MIIDDTSEKRSEDVLSDHEEKDASPCDQISEEDCSRYAKCVGCPVKPAVRHSW